MKLHTLYSTPSVIMALPVSHLPICVTLESSVFHGYWTWKHLYAIQEFGNKGKRQFKASQALVNLFGSTWFGFLSGYGRHLYLCFLIHQRNAMGLMLFAFFGGWFFLRWPFILISRVFLFLINSANSKVTCSIVGQFIICQLMNIVEQWMISCLFIAERKTVLHY